MDEIQEFKNIQIRETYVNKSLNPNTALHTELYSPVYSCYDTYKHLMHLRGNRTPVRQEFTPKTDNSNDIEIIDTPLLWCGTVHPHYGHFLCENISRIPVYKESKIKGKLCFSVQKQDQKINYWFWQIIEHFGYSKKDIFIVDKPIIARRLYVTPQNEMYGQVFGTSEYYLDLLDKNYPSKPLSEKKGIVYISRTKLPNFGCLLDEDYLEFYFKKCGAKIVHPQEISINEQLEIYNSARCIIMLEGSAYHTFQLLGRALGDIIVIKRRNRPPVDHWCRSFIEPRCNSYTFYTDYNGSGVGNYLKTMKDIMDVVKSIDESIPGVEILKIKYIKFMQDDYIKYLKSEAEKINEIEKREIIPKVKTINKSIPNFEIPVFKKTMSYNDFKNFIKSEVNKINNVS